MNDIVREKLCKIIENHGRLVYHEDKKLEGLLKDICGGNKKEINLIMIAVRSGIASEMLNLKTDGNIEILLPQLIKKIIDDYGLESVTAKWAIETVAISLKLISVNYVQKVDLTTKNNSLENNSKKSKALTENFTNNVSQQVILEKEIKIDLGNGVTLEMVRIPAGVFQMGSPSTEANRCSNEGPVHTVTISKDFYMGKFQVTQSQWRHIIGNNSSSNKGGKFQVIQSLWQYIIGNNLSSNKGGDFPVGNVSWNDCQRFISELNIKYSNNGEFSLPTEAEWEYACRGGTTSAYYWGNEINGDYCWYTENSNYQTHPVGQKLPNKFGLYDMNGNVFEWCNDKYDAYPIEQKHGNFKGFRYTIGSVTDPIKPGVYNILRGGGHGSCAAHCRSAYRSYCGPLSLNNFIGFRLVLYIQ